MWGKAMVLSLLIRSSTSKVEEHPLVTLMHHLDHLVWTVPTTMHEERDQTTEIVIEVDKKTTNELTITEMTIEEVTTRSHSLMVNNRLGHQPMARGNRTLKNSLRVETSTSPRNKETITREALLSLVNVRSKVIIARLLLLQRCSLVVLTTVWLRMTSGNISRPILEQWRQLKLFEMQTLVRVRASDS